ncbi:RnaseH [uncultured Caudovirales phage]|uniref:RnaseH n=1 Tax=uncultured Caudovirales phage TaxID=2100421 RepID=A0A6J5L2A0_9CAUD|nr:RnaseH [uncultured Caudovirales phage]
MILLDYNQISLAAILPFKQDLAKGPEEARNLIRHVILSTILNYKKKYSSEHGSVVICCDGRKYWRKEVFQYYKGDRKKNRDKSDIDFNMVFSILDEMRADLINIFPYKVLHIDRAEADDVIAVLAEWSQTNELVEEGLERSPQKMMIVSSDHDFLQLQKWDNIYQFSPIIKKQLKMSKRDLYEKYITHIVKAGDDGIPGILGDDDTIVTEGKRMPRMSAKRLAEFLEHGKKACKNDQERRNWDRNEQLISFEKIPQDIKDIIINEYIQSIKKVDRMKIMNYLIQNKCRLLLNSLEEF